MFGTHESLLDHADASSDLEYALFRDELEQQRTADEAKQSKNLFSLRSVIIFFAIVCGAASVCAAGTYLLSSNTDMNIPLAVYDFAEDSFSMGSYPHLETLLEKKASKGTKHTMTPEQKKKVLDKVKTEVEPCDDFYAHACGMWEDNFDLNGEMSHVDSFDTIMARTVQQQYQTLDDVFPFITPFYNTCMAAVDPVDTNLMKLFTSIDQGVADADTFFHMLGQLNRGTYFCYRQTDKCK